MSRSNLTTRVLTAIVGLPIVVLLVGWAPPWAWALTVLAAAAVGGHELFGMSHGSDRVARGAGAVLCAGVAAGLYLGARDPRGPLTVALLVPIAGSLLALWRPGEIATAGLRLALSMAGPLWVGGMIATLALVHRDGAPNGPRLVALAMSLAWLSDTGGYFFGRFLGRHKLYPSVSPNKTVEGFFGGLLGSLLGALLAHAWYLPRLSLTTALALGITAGVLGQLGDLAESLLKRATGVKDSGNTIPGHGGLLDRVDAVLVTSTLVYLFGIWLGLVRVG